MRYWGNGSDGVWISLAMTDQEEKLLRLKAQKYDELWALVYKFFQYDDPDVVEIDYHDIGEKVSDKLGFT